MNTLLAFDIIPIAILGLAVIVPLIGWLVFRRKIGPESGGGWHLDEWSKNVELEKAGDLFSFDFPDRDGVHRVWKPIKRFAGAHVTMTFDIFGNNPKFEAEDLPATVGLYIGDARIYSSGRYRINLAPGRHTLKVPLMPECWQQVDGYPCNYDEAHERMFHKAINAPTDIGPCFGGTTKGWAHGANLVKGSPPATFKLVSFSA